MPRGVDIVGAFGGLREAGNAPELAQGVKFPKPSGDQFMGVGLMPHVKDDLVLGAIHQAVAGKNDLHRPKARGHVAAVF